MPLNDTLADTTAVRAGHQLDEEALRAWWIDHVDSGARQRFGLAQFKGGQSNPTFLVETPGGRYVLRRKPAGTLLPSAHAVDREFRVMQALAGSGVPVPRVHALCTDAAVIGTMFYVMDCVPGRILWDPHLPGMTSSERAALYDDMNRTLAALHEVDVAAVSLADYGRTGGYIARQLDRWTRQYRASETEPIEAMEQLIAWLPRHQPADTGTRLVHGDFRLDNLVFAQDAPRVVAVLDWELSTLGDPMVDFAYHCMAWRLPPSVRGLGDLDAAQLQAAGIPTVAAYLARYCERRALPRVDAQTWRFYEAFNLFRAAAIAQGIMGRALAGNAASSEALQAGRQARQLAELGWHGVGQSA
ncbi:phosphotransferase [uncultured Pseudacidovorax sp.]|uniref:phosphotransferase n=1 Tax=uncultured Pseudacidovorax sp. TaxID=679313 RepID=UPI0025E630D1|nr:phosphotransferase [uncultured Pseudacidovorax sp.]